MQHAATTAPRLTHCLLARHRIDSGGLAILALFTFRVSMEHTSIRRVLKDSEVSIAAVTVLSLSQIRHQNPGLVIWHLGRLCARIEAPRPESLHV